MSKMSKSEKDYACQRINGMYHDKKASVIETHTAPGKTLATKQRIELICDSKVPMLPKSKIAEYYNPDLVDCFDFSKHVRDKFVDDDKIEKIMAPIHKQMTKAKDEIMLGDSKEALRLIKEFEAVISK